MIDSQKQAIAVLCLGASLLDVPILTAHAQWSQN